MDRSGQRRSPAFRPRYDVFEARLVLSQTHINTFPPLVDPHRPYIHPLGTPAVRPNLPVLPFGTTKNPTFIDPTVDVVHGAHIIVGTKTFIGPFVRLDATTGFIKIGTGSAILDNATVLSNPAQSKNPTTSVQIGDNVSIGFGATILGPSTIGAYQAKGSTTVPPATAIGPNAVIDHAYVEAGSIVGALAKIGPGVTVPSGFYVLPGANITTQAQASNPALGMVVPVTSAQLKDVTNSLSDNAELATGYETLYQGNSATGTSPGVATSVKGVNNGDLTTIEGASDEPSSANGVDFEPSKTVGPTFLAPGGQQLPGLISSFRARVVGAVVFNEQAANVAHSMGTHDAIRADSGQPFTFGSSFLLGNNVSINSPLSGATSTGGQMTFNNGFVAGDNAVILGGPKMNSVFDENVHIGAGAVVVGSSIGQNSTVGPRAYIDDSTLGANANIPAGAIIIKNVFKGFVQS